MEKLQEVHSMNDLHELIITDRESSSPLLNRFPIRFIFLNSFDELKNLVKILSSNNIEIKDITSCLSNENSWLTKTDIQEFINSLSEDAIVLPLSEFMRFQDDDSFSSTLRSLTEIEKQGKRFYIPLIGIFEKSKKFFDNYHREWVPIWKLSTISQKVHIYQVNYNFDYKNISLYNFQIVSTTKEWFNIWKKENVKDIISFSKSLSYFYKNYFPDQTFYLDDISNPKQFISKIFGIEIPIKFNEQETEYWDILVEQISNLDIREITFTKLFLNHFNLHTIDNLDFFRLLTLYFGTDSSYDHWLIRNFTLSINNYKFTYLYECLNKLKKFTKVGLSEELWFHIFEISDRNINPEFFEERKILLHYLHKEHQIFISESNIRDNLQNLNRYHFKKQLLYLTNISQTEKALIINNLKNEDISLFLPDLKSIYPELYYYLDWKLIEPDNEIDNWIIQYFKHYNYSKVKHQKAEEIDEILNIKNKDKVTFSQWYYSIPQAETNRDYNNIWIDGLGAEWFPLIINLINEFGESNGKYVKEKKITRVQLPSITKCNKFNFKKMEELDNYIHKQKSYTYPICLIEEIEIVTDLIKKILSKDFEKILITSDHGLSFMCLKEFGNYKKLTFGDSEHEGRYMWINDSNFSNDTYYIKWDVYDGNCKDKQAIVATKHVSLNNTPFREVHGGATPEEILVPYVLIESIKEKIDYNINPTKFDNLSVSNPKITLRINPTPLTIPKASINGKTLKLFLDKKTNKCSIDLTGLKPKKHLILLEIGSNSFEIEVIIKGGFIEKDLLDL